MFSDYLRPPLFLISKFQIHRPLGVWCVRVYVSPSLPFPSSSRKPVRIHRLLSSTPQVVVIHPLVVVIHPAAAAAKIAKNDRKSQNGSDFDENLIESIAAIRSTSHKNFPRHPGTKNMISKGLPRQFRKIFRDGVGGMVSS